MFSFFEPQSIIAAVGLLGITAIVFAETGLFFGFFLPGDSLLFTAGFLASQGHVSMGLLLLCAFVAAIAGDTVGYFFGKKIGPKIFNKEDSLFFHKEHIARSQHFFEKYGAKTIIIARFVPVVRTFAPILAGVGSMSYKTFIVFNILGAFIWTWSMIWAGYALGRLIPDPDAYVLPIIAVIILISSAPVLRQIWRIHISKK